MRQRRPRFLGFALASLMTPAFLVAQQQPKVIAYVKRTPILEAQIRRLLHQQWKNEIAPSHKSRQTALRVVIDQRLASLKLMEQLEGATDARIEAALLAWRAQLAERNQTEAEFLAESGMTMEVVRHEIAWQVNWKLYLDTHLTEENLQEYFEKHRRDLDGTQLKIRQIQWNLKDPDGAGTSLRQSLLTKANDLKSEIQNGTVDFASAAEELSEATSASEGGSIGWISRDGPMAEEFTRAAFSLKRGDMTTAVSPFGVHLILCEEIRPGTRTFEQCRPKVETAAKRFLFERLATQARGDVQLLNVE